MVDVEKVEWLNRRSYSAIGLLLGREGRVLLRSEQGLEDWFELLEECTMTSKQRRMALRITQGPRSRASLAAPPTHASIYANHSGLGGTYSSAIEDWLLSRNKTINSSQNFALSDSVPDLSSIIENGGLSTNHSTPKKIPHITRNGNMNGYSSPNNYSNGYGHNSPSGRNIKNGYIHEEEEEVQLRNGRRYNDENEKDDWMYRRPNGPNDQRHSCKYKLNQKLNTEIIKYFFHQY